MRRTVLAVLGVLPIIFACSSSSEDKTAVTTPEAAVEKAKQAWASIHEKASWQSAYSKESTVKFEPYAATLEDGVWVVRGTIPPGYQGEVLETTVRQSDGDVSVKVVRAK
jgi:hypothetical protein